MEDLIFDDPKFQIQMGNKKKEKGENFIFYCNWVIKRAGKRN